MNRAAHRRGEHRTLERIQQEPVDAALCTIGYEKRSLDEYIDLLLANGVEVVLDVRETAWSHKPGFSKTAFSGGRG